MPAQVNEGQEQSRSRERPEPERWRGGAVQRPQRKRDPHQLFNAEDEGPLDQVSREHEQERARQSGKILLPAQDGPQIDEHEQPGEKDLDGDRPVHSGGKIQEGVNQVGEGEGVLVGAGEEGRSGQDVRVPQGERSPLEHGPRHKALVREIVTGVVELNPLLHIPVRTMGFPGISGKDGRAVGPDAVSEERVPEKNKRQNRKDHADDDGMTARRLQLPPTSGHQESLAHRNPTEKSRAKRLSLHLRSAARSL